MRSFIAAAVAAASVVSGMEFGIDLFDNYVIDRPLGEPLEREVHRNGFGMTVEQATFADNSTETWITAPVLPAMYDIAHQTAHIERMTEYHRQINEGLLDAASPAYTCDNRNPYGDDTTGLALLPAFGGLVTPENPSVSFEGKCFSDITMEYQHVSDTQFDIVFTTKNKKSSTCNETVLFANTEIQHVEIYFFSGAHKMHFTTPTQESQDDMKISGIGAFNFCDSPKGLIESLWETLKMFLGGLGANPSAKIFGTHVPKYQEEANKRFIKETMNVDLVERTTKKVEIDPSLIQSGDFFGVMRLDGLDQIIMYGTGAYIGHNVMALRMEDDELYIVESQDAWYWPTHGLQRTKWADWIKQAEDASFHVTWHRMRDEVRANFNVDDAIAFFKSTEGMPYGYHNFLYGWIDTAEDNWPPLLPVHFVPAMFSVVEKFAQDTVYSFFVQAIDKRLGTQDTTIQENVESAYQQGMGLDTVMGMVEQDGWMYSDGYSYVCSAYVAAIFKAGGLLPEDVNATEFATKDVYILNFWDVTTPLPEQCVAADPSLPYCQLLGNYRVELPSYNTVTPYDHMFETCEINYPTYTRSPTC